MLTVVATTVAPKHVLDVGKRTVRSRRSKRQYRSSPRCRSIGSPARYQPFRNDPPLQSFPQRHQAEPEQATVPEQAMRRSRRPAGLREQAAGSGKNPRSAPRHLRYPAARGPVSREPLEGSDL